jgi:hypothetical protein
VAEERQGPSGVEYHKGVIPQRTVTLSEAKGRGRRTDERGMQSWRHGRAACWHWPGGVAMNAAPSSWIRMHSSQETLSQTHLLDSTPHSNSDSLPA